MCGVDRTASLQESPLFRLDTNPLFFLTTDQLAAARRLFQQMEADAASDYRHKHELVRTQLQLVIHEALRQRPEPLKPPGASAANRLGGQFLHLLEQQFPVTSSAVPLALRTPQVFAERLHIHVNHLNRVVRETTGKTTSVHLTERILHEAQTLLRHTTWAISDVAQSLGFVDPTYFNHFFKKHGGVSPRDFRQQAIRDGTIAP